MGRKCGSESAHRPAGNRANIPSPSTPSRQADSHSKTGSDSETPATLPIQAPQTPSHQPPPHTIDRAIPARDRFRKSSRPAPARRSPQASEETLDHPWQVRPQIISAPQGFFTYAISPLKCLHVHHEWRNKFLAGDCLDLLADVPDGIADLIITSPPYADQRKQTYGGVPIDRY